MTYVYAVEKLTATGWVEVDLFETERDAAEWVRQRQLNEGGALLGVPRSAGQLPRWEAVVTSYAVQKRRVVPARVEAGT